jgi:hypothetical protein
MSLRPDLDLPRSIDESLYEPWKLKEGGGE